MGQACKFWCAWIALTAAILVSGPVSGHGPAPSPLRVLYADGQQIELVQTNIGMAMHSEGSDFRYGCPSQWGELETPLSVAVDGRRIVVVGVDGVYFSDDRGCNFELLDDPLTLEVARMASLVEDQGRVYGLEKGSEVARVFGWSEDQGIVLAADFERRFDSMLVSDNVAYVAGARPSLEVVRVDQADALPWSQLVRHQPESVGQSGVQRITVRWIDPEDPQRLWFSVTTDDGGEWWRSDDGGATMTFLAAAELSVHGPAPLCGGVVASIDGVLTPDPDFPPQCDMEAMRARNFNCLGVRGDFVWGCELRQLYRLGDGGGVATAERVFGIDQLVGPEVDCPVETQARQECEQDWLHFGAESGLVDPNDIFGTGNNGQEDPDDDGDMPEAPPSEPVSQPSSTQGCAQGPGGPLSSGVILMALMAWAVFRRRRRRQSNQSSS